MAKRSFSIFLDDSDREFNIYFEETIGVLMEEQVTKIVVVYLDEKGQMSVNMQVVPLSTVKDIMDKIKDEKIV